MKISEPLVLNQVSGIEANSALLPIPNDRRSKLAASYISKTLNYILIPQFSLDSIDWLGASSIQFKLSYSLPSSFTLPVSFTAPAGATFCPVIRYDVANVPIRYKLWDNVSELLYIDLYAGQLIFKNFFIEIWNVEDFNTITNESPLILNTSRLRKPNLTLGSYLCNEFTDVGLDETGDVIIEQDNTMILNIWNPSTGDYWSFDVFGNGTITHI